MTWRPHGPRLAGVLVVLLFGLGACQRREKSKLERGAAVFSRACASCHGVALAQRQQLGFEVPPPDLSDPTLQDRLGDAQLVQVIRNGKGQMPPFGKMLPSEEVSDLLGYLRSLRQSAPGAP